MKKTNLPAKIAAVTAAGCSEARNGAEADAALARAAEIYRESLRLFLYVTRVEPGIPEGYRFAARVTIGFDGGNHGLRGDLWKCERCAAVVFPGDHAEHTREHAEFDELRQLVLRLRRGAEEG